MGCKHDHVRLVGIAGHADDKALVATVTQLPVRGGVGWGGVGGAERGSN